MLQNNKLSKAEKLLERGKFKKAALVYEEILKDDPESATAHQN